MRAFINIIIIGLIGLCSSTYLFNLSPIDYRGSIEIETPVEESTLSLQSQEQEIRNPESITINHIATKDEVIRIITNSIFSVDIYKDNELLKSNINNLELISPSIDTTISVNREDPLITTLNISQKNVNLEDGVYEFVFNSNLIADENKSSVSITVTYDTTGIYYPAVNMSPQGTKGLTLYFTTDNEDILIPVTRFVVEDKSITRMAIEQLQNGPVNSGLKTVIKDVTNTTYNNGNVLIDIPSSYKGYIDAKTSSLSYNSFVKSIFAVERYWPIYSVTFAVDRNKVETYFNGIDTNTLLNAEQNFMLYMAYKADERYYLFEHQLQPEEIGITINESAEVKAKKLFDAYFAEIPYGINPIPKTVTLNDALLQGTMLILDFNEELLNIHKGRDDLRNMMIESLIFTFTTIPGVDSIKLTVDGEELNNFIKGVNTVSPLYPPEFINPEAVDSEQ